MSNRLLLACSHESLINDFGREIKDRFKYDIIHTPDDLTNDIRAYALVVLDQGFTAEKGLDFLESILGTTRIPVLLLSDPEDASSAAKAMSMGAHNFLVKTGNFISLLAFAINDVLKRINDTLLLQRTIQDLREKIRQLESQLESSNLDVTAANEEAQTLVITANPPSSSASPAIGINQTILSEVVESLRSGDITLPSFPRVSSAFRQLLTTEYEMLDITNLLARDTGISSKLISVANSTFYRGLSPTKTLEQAVSRIGISETRNYVELIENRALYTNQNKKFSAYLEKLWHHSLTVAYAAKEIAGNRAGSDPAEIFTMGLFHDIGKLVLIQIVSKLESKGACDPATPVQEYLHMLEKHHGKFGESLLKRWKLGQQFCHVARFTDDLDNAGNWPDELMIVNLADSIARALGHGEPLPAGTSMSKGKAAQQLALDANALRAIGESVSKKLNNDLAA